MPCPMWITASQRSVSPASHWHLHSHVAAVCLQAWVESPFTSTVCLSRLAGGEEGLYHYADAHDSLKSWINVEVWRTFLKVFQVPNMGTASHMHPSCTGHLNPIHSECNTDLISHQTTHGALALCGNPSSNTGCPNFARLRDDDVAQAVFLIVVVQDELRQLGGLAAACGSLNDHDRVVFYERNQLEGGVHRTQAVRTPPGHLFSITEITMKSKNKFWNRVADGCAEQNCTQKCTLYNLH